MEWHKVPIVNSESVGRGADSRSRSMMRPGIVTRQDLPVERTRERAALSSGDKTEIKISYDRPWIARLLIQIAQTVFNA